MGSPHRQGDGQQPSPECPRGSLQQRFVRGVSWNVLSTTLGQGSAFAASLIIASRLGPQLFGELSQLQHTALTLSALAQVATGATATRYVARYRISDPARVGRILGFCALFTLMTGLTAALLLLLLSDWLSAKTLNAPQLSGGLKVMAAYVLVSAMSGYQTGALAGLEGYRRMARVGTLHAIVHIALAFIGVWIYGLPGALWALVASLILKWWLYHRAIRMEAKRFAISISYVLQNDERSVLLHFSLPAALPGLTSMPALWLANTFLLQQPGGFSQLGLFAAALNLKTLVTLVPSIVSSVGGVLVQSHSGETDGTRFRTTYWANVFASAVAVGLAGVTVYLLTDLLLPLFGAGFTPARPVVEILILAAIVETLMVSLYQLVYSLERMWWSLLVVTLPRDLVIVTSAFLLIPHMQVAGLAWAHVLGWSTAFLAVLWFVRAHRERLL